MRAALVTFAAWLLGRPALYGIPSAVPGLRLGETIYREPSAPHAMTGFGAALANRTDAASARAVGGRRTVARALLEALVGASEIDPIQPLGGPDRASFLRLPVLATGRDSAERLRREGTTLGVQSGYPMPLYRLAAAQPILLRGSTDSPLDELLPGSRELSERLLTLPTHGWVGPAEIRRLVGLARGEK